MGHSLIIVVVASLQPMQVEDQASRDTAGGAALAPRAGERAEEALWGELQPGEGFTVARSALGELNISAYALVRYLNQLPAEQSFVNHLGVEVPIDTRNDFNLHRVLVHFKGWIYDQRLNYQVILWTVNATEQVRIVGALTYRLHSAFNIAAGIGGLPGTRSLQGSHPFWQAHDRVMADEFFRPGFTGGVWATGALLPRFFYKAMIGNNLSQLGISAAELTRDLAKSASVWWLPTTGEFGPNGSFNDFEMHETLALRLGVSGTQSREDRFAQTGTPSPDNTQIRLQDSTLFFQTGALAPDVTVQQANYWMLATDAGLKYRGFFLQGEYYLRLLEDFDADGPVPFDTLFDHGFYVQGGFFPLPRRLHVYAATSWVFGDPDKGFDTSYELLAGTNIYPFATRNHRLNIQVVAVDRSAASSTFGYYIGGHRGVTLSVDMSVLF